MWGVPQHAGTVILKLITINLPQTPVPIEGVQFPATVSKVAHFDQLSWVSIKLLSFGKLFPNFE